MFGVVNRITIQKSSKCCFSEYNIVKIATRILKINMLKALPSFLHK